MADSDELELEESNSVKRTIKPVSQRNVALKNSKSITTTQYCEKLQEWMWQYYFLTAFHPCLLPQTGTGTPGAPQWGANVSNTDPRYWFGQSIGFPHSYSPDGQSDIGTTANNANQRGVNVRGHNRNTDTHPGQEYLIPSLFHRFLAEIVDFFILFFIKATIILCIIQFSGMEDLVKFATHFIVEEINDDTSIEELQKMMAVALVYRILVCFYEIICIWGAGGATPGKFLLGLRVVTCNTSILVQPNRVCVVPASNVSLSASTIRALNKNFSIAFFFPGFITLLFFQQNRTVYDIMAGTIVVKRNRLR